VTGIGFLHGVHGQRTDGIDGQLILGAVVGGVRGGRRAHDNDPLALERVEKMIQHVKLTTVAALSCLGIMKVWVNLHYQPNKKPPLITLK
jgi:hypothetical protein